MATFNPAVEAVVYLYVTEQYAEMEKQLQDLVDLGYPELAAKARAEIEDMIAEQHYLDEGEELELW
jgi:hypothetical protein